MIDQANIDDVTCREIESEEFLEAYALSEEFHEFREVTREVVTDLPFCKIMVVEEECSYCSALMPGVAILGEAPELMQEYKRMINDVYAAFYENPRQAAHVTFSGDLADDALQVQIEIQTTLLEVMELASDDAESETGKRSKQELWTRILGPEYADVD